MGNYKAGGRGRVRGSARYALRCERDEALNETKHLEGEIKKIGDWIQKNANDEIDGSACDVAVRLLSRDHQGRKDCERLHDYLRENYLIEHWGKNVFDAAIKVISEKRAYDADRHAWEVKVSRNAWTAYEKLNEEFQETKLALAEARLPWDRSLSRTVVRLAREARDRLVVRGRDFRLRLRESYDRGFDAGASARKNIVFWLTEGKGFERVFAPVLVVIASFIAVGAALAHDRRCEREALSGPGPYSASSSFGAPSPEATFKPLTMDEAQHAVSVDVCEDVRCLECGKRAVFRWFRSSNAPSVVGRILAPEDHQLTTAGGVFRLVHPGGIILWSSTAASSTAPVKSWR